MATSELKQLFSASLAKDAVYKTGLRSFMEYRDLGIEKATHGQFRAHVIRIKKDAGAHDLHTTGLHQHLCDFQMFYVLKGWIKFVYEGEVGIHKWYDGNWHDWESLGGSLASRKSMQKYQPLKAGPAICVPSGV